MLSVQLPRIRAAHRVLDSTMTPLMYVLGAFKRDSIQQTHPWHTWRHFKPDDVDSSLSVARDGTDTTWLASHGLFLFHAPLLGGWTHYACLDGAPTTDAFHIGWVVYSASGDVLDYGISRKPITTRVRMLVGPVGHRNIFFAVDGAGKQCALALAGTGRLGDMKYPNTPLL